MRWQKLEGEDYSKQLAWGRNHVRNINKEIKSFEGLSDRQRFEMTTMIKTDCACMHLHVRPAATTHTLVFLAPLPFNEYD